MDVTRGVDADVCLKTIILKLRFFEVYSDFKVDSRNRNHLLRILKT